MADYRRAHARSGFQAAVVGGRIVAAGGEQLAEGDSTIGEVEILNPKTGRWRRLPSMLTPRHGLGIITRARRVFAIEGGPMPGLAFSTGPRVPRSRPVTG